MADPGIYVKGASGLQIAATVPGPGVPAGGTAGQVLKKNAAPDFDTIWGNYNLDSLTDVTVTSPATGNVIRWSGTVWVNAVLAAADVSYAGSTNLAATNVEAALDELDSEKAATGHTHTAQTAATTAFTPAGNIAATDVQAAIVELDTEKSSTGHVHAAASITYAGSTNLAATNVEAALDELDTEKAATGHTHTAQTASTTAFTPAGNIAATDVQAAIAELDAEKSGTAHTHAPAADVTASRPATPATGFMFFDTTLGKPVWYNGTGWVDATGTAA